MFKSKNPVLKTYLLAAIGSFVFFAGWWVRNQLTGDAEGSHAGELFSDTYWVMPLIGGIGGLWASKLWGGVKSVFGKAIFLFSLGLLAQVFGQVVYSYYALHLEVEVPYPSIGDIGFFGSILFYIAALMFLAKTTGAQFSRVGTKKKIIAIALPLALLIVSYVAFLKGYEFDWSSPLIPLLDFGYPFGQAIYIALALVTYFLSLGLLGGIMKNKILLLLGALVVQYSADYVFLFQYNHETWYAGGFNDLMYLVAYFLMAISLLRLGSAALNSSATTADTSDKTPPTAPAETTPTAEEPANG